MKYVILHGSLKTAEAGKIKTSGRGETVDMPEAERAHLDPQGNKFATLEQYSEMQKAQAALAKAKELAAAAMAGVTVLGNKPLPELVGDEAKAKPAVTPVPLSPDLKSKK